jgi:chromatin segregation and condensation protein Rec8/ScpA/Scc1 (kleisin family)
VEVIADSLREVDTSKVVVDQVSTQEAAEELFRLLERGPTRFEAVARGRGISWAVALFLAMLELAMRGDIELSEGSTVGEIQIRLRTER